MQSAPFQATQAQTQLQINTFIRSVYNWMGIGLALTGFVAYYVSGSATLQNLFFGNPMLLFGLIIVELAMVFTLSARIAKLKATTAAGLFIVYSALNGITISSIFLIYTRSSITSTFFICAATFAVSSIYGMVTKKDLTSFGQFLFMGLIGIVIASVVNMFVRSSGMSMIISYIGVIVFVGLTAYDTQKMKNMAMTQPEGMNAATVQKGAIIGALSLYLDFINLFLMLLHILGNRE